MEEVLTVFLKVAIMLVMMTVGWILTKTGKLTEKGSGEITKILLDIVTPCLIVNSFLTAEPGAISGGELVLAFVVSSLAIGIAIGLSYLFFRKKPVEQQVVLRFSLIFSNAGFMGIPLVQSIIGDGGIIYASFFVVAFNLFCWTYGYSMMNRGQKLRLRSVLLNPGTIGLVVGLPIYLLRLRLPEILSAPIQGFSDLNTPLAMLVVGSYIAKVKFRDFLTDRSLYLVSFGRLILAPAVLIAVLCLIRPGRELFLSTVIQAAAPSAANCVLFAVMFHQDARLASKAVAASTLLSVVTIPLMTIAAEFFVSLVL